MFQVLFWKNPVSPILAKNYPKLANLGQNAQKLRFFAFSWNPFVTFSEKLQLIRVCKHEKNFPSAFLKKIPVLPILAKNCPKLAIWLDTGFWQDAGIAGNSWKNLKVGVFGTDFKQVPFVFQQATCTFWMLGTCRKFGCLSLYFDNFFARKKVGSRETPRDDLFK